MSLFNSVSDPGLVKLGIHLDQLQSGIEEPNNSLINESLAKLNKKHQYNCSNGENDEGDELEKTHIGDFLIPKLLAVSTTTDDDELRSKLLRLLEVILQFFSFEVITSKYIPIDLISEGLDSPLDEIVVLIIRVIGNIDTADLLASTPLINKMVNLLKTPDTSVKVVNEIEWALCTLSESGELIRRRLKSKEIMETFHDMRFGEDKSGKLKPRLLDLIKGLLGSLKEDIPDKLYLVDLEEFTKEEDVLYLAYLINFYTNLMMAVADTKSLGFVLPKLEVQFNYITRLYTEDEFKADTKFFFKQEPVILISGLAHYLPDIFRKLELKHNILRKAKIAYLSQEDSNYLLANIPPLLLQESLGDEFISQIPLNLRTIQIYRNLISDEKTFFKLELLTSSKLQSLQVIEFLEILSSMTDSWFSCETLLRDHPGVVNRLLDEIVSVSNPEVWDLKVKVLENLLHFREKLGIWETKITQNYTLMKQGKSLDHGADVMIDTVI